MEITRPDDPTIVNFEPEKEVLFNQLFQMEKMRLLTERMNAVNEKLGLNNPKAGRVTARGGSTDDILPFYAIKSQARKLKGGPLNHLWRYHTSEYWDEQMKEVEAEARQLVEEGMQTPPQQDAKVEIGESTGIVLR